MKADASRPPEHPHPRSTTDHDNRQDWPVSSEPTRQHVTPLASQTEATSPIELLQRWMEFGGEWRVDSRTSAEVTVALCRCDGGEEIDRLVSTDPDFRAWLGARTTSQD